MALAAPAQQPGPLAALQPLPPVPPITDAERRGRIEKARRLMTENGIDAMFLEGGTSMFYFTGVRWGNSERTFGVVIPAKGELAWVTPGFEESRARELIKFSNDVRVWQEDESPYAVIAKILRDRGAATGKIGIEERARFFIFDGVRQVLPQAQFVNATPVTAGCRMIKSPAEIALMQRANDITLQALGASFKTLKEGMTQQELSANVGEATRKLGGVGDGALVIFGKYTAFPHGSIQPQKLHAGDVVLIDAGCTVDGYASDITRTTVFGKPTQRQRDVWDVEKRAQSAAFAAAQLGATCESVDAAARKVITSRRIRSRLQAAGPAASHGARHRSRRSRVDELRARQHDQDSAGHVLQRRADDRDLRRVRHSARGLSAHDGERAEDVHATESVDRAAGVDVILMRA